VHTIFTDGTASVKEVAEEGLRVGIEEILFSDHIRHDSKYFPEFVEQINGVNLPGIKTYVGIETKILDLNGTLDCTQEIGEMCAAIIGSVHSPPLGGRIKTQSWRDIGVEIAIELEFQLAMAIVTKSQAHILGHPFGMVVKHFGYCPVGYLETLANTCREYNKAFELNPCYCIDQALWIDTVKNAECKVSLGSDAHQICEVGSAWNVFIMKGFEQ
jgi:putative hydrolase